MGAIRTVAGLAVAMMLTAAPAFAQDQQQRPRPRIIVAPITEGADPVAAGLRESLRARIEEAFANLRVFTVETRGAGEGGIIGTERSQIDRARAQNINLIIFPVVDSLTCYREARPITAMPGKYNERGICEGVIRVRVINPSTDELRTSFELEQSYTQNLGVLDQLELQNYQARERGVFRGTMRYDGQSREFVGLSQQLASALTERVYDDAYPPEIIDVSGPQVYVSRGTRGGFNVGDRLGVFSRSGRQLRHPVTGEVLGEATSRVATLTITEARDDYSAGTLSEVAGDVQIGALVRR